jgi:hypothetical protein
MFRSLVRVLKHFLEDFTKTSPAIADLIATNPLASEFMAMLPKLLFHSVGDAVEGIVDIEHYTAQLQVFPEIVTAIAKGIDDADTTSDEFESLRVEMEQAVALHLVRGGRRDLLLVGTVAIDQEIAALWFRDDCSVGQGYCLSGTTTLLFVRDCTTLLYCRHFVHLPYLFSMSPLEPHHCRVLSQRMCSSCVLLLQ